MTEYNVGDIILFDISESHEIVADMGEIIAKDTLEQKTIYWVKCVQNFEGVGPWNYCNVLEDHIMEISKNGERPENDNWCKQHITEINQVFGKDVSHNVLFVYDDEESMITAGFENFLPFRSKFTKEVCGKLVFMVC